MLFRSGFHQAFGHQNESENLCPLRNDVADDLSPLALRVHGAERYDPSDAGNYQEYSERMLTKKLQNRRWQGPLRLLAFSRSLFVQEFRHHDGDEDACPIGDRISEK